MTGTVPESTRDPGLQPERTTLAWRRTLISLVVVDLFIWRSWLTSEPSSGTIVTGLPGLDYQGICALAAAAATVVLASVVWVRSRQLQAGFQAAPTRLILASTLAVMGLGAAAIAAISLGG
ncbi:MULTISPECIES: DUF202 domain-containing protein [Paenarthrobacter]|uniref:Uncharacterized membrane protein YidH (DUF202 family) n=1 Tax=Paenarthrobacter nicotinovorans TaxID=29320 RepID=A0ABT9THX6_PAENI|nr:MULTISPECIES: DUF202 domain-containing protein [Paenarthrobacter]KQR06534.1 hypothetical protein ASF74_03970 [Arthrobacter sp. Leaf145]SKB30756.1 protein of unknown function [Arthrobacter sp. 31Cvi3.1E]BCW11194.1 hypothetical protein NtRootA2_24760 [Arthrobacter sp. NtRootA2]BCW15276.1 hypothetical protein NtRootA4_22550 [Arthrobacter sp. NtRootA4]BCW23611.1 hypothetical protein NtRootC7_24780 [Arthrobacter sp. NtRootC7]BCW27879.1 hypothetical protein NtRootC45_24790 [Arthrobacter sp. NtRo